MQNILAYALTIDLGQMNLYRLYPFIGKNACLTLGYCVITFESRYGDNRCTCMKCVSRYKYMRKENLIFIYLLHTYIIDHYNPSVRPSFSVLFTISYINKLSCVGDDFGQKHLVYIKSVNKHHTISSCYIWRIL